MPFPYDFEFPFDLEGSYFKLITYTETYYDLIVYASEVEQ